MHDSTQIVLHGGDVRTASQVYGIPEADWLDLSTGINPYIYPHRSLSEKSFQAMPYLTAEFEQAIGEYFFRAAINGKGPGAIEGADAHADCMSRVCVAPGSQAIIPVLPEVLRVDNRSESLPVLVPSVGYQEHAESWSLAGHELVRYESMQNDVDLYGDLTQQLCLYRDQHQAVNVVVITPNNPAGSALTKTQLASLADLLVAPGKLIIDEAFIEVAAGYEGSDCSSESVLWESFRPNMVVLRSLGKFFGLPGLRVGFAFAVPDIIQALNKRIGLWSVNGPAQELASRALRDKIWQQENSKRLYAQMDVESAMFQRLASEVALTQGHEDAMQRIAHNPLFSTFRLTKAFAHDLVERFAKRGILLRLFELNAHEALIRVGRAGPKFDRLAHCQGMLG